MKRFFFFLPFLALSCSIGPRPIHYGEESCTYCKMTIVDEQHAAQLVTSKGKIHSFDAIECLMMYYRENSQTEYSYFMVNDYENPGTLLKAQESAYLISDKIPSPMGENISALQNKQHAEALRAKHSGELLNWNELIQRFQ